MFLFPNPMAIKLNERAELLSFIEENDIDNVVFVAADVHMTAVNNLTYQTEPSGEQIATGVFEVTTGAIAFSNSFKVQLCQVIKNKE